jgi:hypothetical protein
VNDAAHDAVDWHHAQELRRRFAVASSIAFYRAIGDVRMPQLFNPDT